MLAPRPAAARARVPGSLGIALGLPAGVLVAATSGGSAVVGVVVATVVAAGLGLLTEPLPAGVVGLQVWACWDGFVQHRLGVLSAEPADRAALAVVVGAALVAAGAAALRRRSETRRRRYAARSLLGTMIE